jgi:hypothetical protein
MPIELLVYYIEIWAGNLNPRFDLTLNTLAADAQALGIEEGGNN